MIYYPISALINAIASTIACVVVITKNPKSQLNRSFSYFTFSVAFWSYCYFLWQISNNASNALFWCRMLMAGAIFIPSTFLHFSVTFIGQHKRYLKVIVFWYIVSSFFLLLDSTSLFVKDVKPRLLFPYWPTAGITYGLFLAMFIGLVIYAHILLYKSYREFSGFKRNQIKYIFLGTAIGFLGGATNYPLWYDIPILPTGNAFVAVYVLLVAYSIIKYRLMDITVAITRTGIFIAVYTFVLGLPFALGIWLKTWLLGIFGANWWISPLVLMAVLATAGPFIYIYIDRKAEEKLLKEQRRYQETLKQASLGMTRIRNLRKLLDLITHIVTRTVHISFAAVYLRNKESGEYILQVMRDKGRMPLSILSSEHSLIRQLTSIRQPLIYEEIRQRLEDSRESVDKEVAESMRQMFAAVIIPSFLEDRFMGFLVLGDKLSGQIYTAEDLNVFQILASQAALAIENAQFYDEAKEMQEQIAQAEKMATIGTMADGLSHQINNRFNALSLIAGDTVDSIKMTDTSGCTPEVQEMLKRITYALERIQVNVLQGGEVVRGILKYTRKGEEKFEALTLDEILDYTMEMVQFKVKLSEIDLIRDYPKDIPRVKANLVQLQEVFFNFIDNAYAAILERRDTLKEAGYRGRITVLAEAKDNTLEIIVEDNGLGIKEENLKRVFAPFFTTKASSRMGTGLGLYVIKKIICDGHKGNISFESNYGVGTRFIIDLPLAR